MAEFHIDIMRLYFWHPESKVVIAMEDMPIELVPEIEVIKKLPQELRQNLTWAKMGEYIKFAYEEVLRFQLIHTSPLKRIIVD